MRSPRPGSKPAALLVALGAAVAAITGACGTDAVGIEACRSIETARCQHAAACGVDLTEPVHRGSPGTDIDACVSFYRDQCLHGLASGTDPGTAAVNDCVAAINGGNCDTVKTPQNDPACAFLAAAPPAADAGSDTSTADAADAAFAGCASGCIDFGVQFCGQAHFCACQQKYDPPPNGCIASSTNVTAPYVAGYCCD